MVKNIAVIVLYNPNIEKIRILYEAITDQNFYVIFVDNSEYKIDYNWITLDGEIIYNLDNKGIAFAQNMGIKRATNIGYKFIAFFDQDSNIDKNFFRKALVPFGKGDLLVSVPVPINFNSKEEYPCQQLNRYGWPKNVFSNELNSNESVDLAISSGTLTTKKVIEIVGNFDEDFFIDFVDIEWCLRCRKKEVPIILNKDIVLNHLIGESDIDLKFMKINKHSSYRTYYKVRNSILLLRKNLKFLFVFRQIITALIHNFILVFFVDSKVDYIKSYTLGIWDGIKGKTGKKI